MDNYKKQFMDEAIRLAEENVHSGNGGPFGAVVVRHGEIIARGSNMVTALNDPTAHAEIVAIRQACEKSGWFEIIDCEIYSSCEPCPMCLGAIYWARPDRLIYGTTRHDASDAGFDDAFIYHEMALPEKERKIPVIYLPDKEARKVFLQWKKRENKTAY